MLLPVSAFSNSILGRLPSVPIEIVAHPEAVLNSGLLAARGIADSGQRYVNVLVCNMSDRTVTLKPGDSVCVALIVPSEAGRPIVIEPLPCDSGSAELNRNERVQNRVANLSSSD